MGHWAYRYIDLLIARGRMGNLQPLVQPYRRSDLATAIRHAEAAGELSDAERSWLAPLQTEFASELSLLADTLAWTSSAVNAELAAGSWVMSERHRDLLRPEGGGAVYPFLNVGFSAEFPSVVADLWFRWDQWLLNDPQFPDGTVVESHPRVFGFLDFGARVEQGYLEVQAPYFRIFAGRIYRNWGLPETSGLLISNYPYSYDQIGYRVGTDKLSVTGFVAQLDEFPDNVKRWLSAHRVDWRARDNLVLAVTEEVVYGGENRSFDFRLANPISVWLVAGFGEDFAAEGPNTNNNLTELSVWWRPTSGLLTYLSVAIDDFPGGGTPALYAAHLSLQLPRIGRDLAARLDYSQVATLTYRSVKAFEVVAFRNLGLGRDISDHDLLSVQLDWIPRGSLILSPRAELLRRGEGDLRDPWPAGVTNSGPTLFTGEVETTLRLAFAGQWRPSRLAVLRWDIGGNFVWDAGHEAGRQASDFAARVRVAFTPRISGKL